MHPILFRIPLPAWLVARLTAWLASGGSGSSASPHDIPIHSYGIMLGLSLVFAWYGSLARGEKGGMPREALASCFIVSTVFAIVMSRLLYVVTNPKDFHHAADVFAVWRGGLVAYGGFLGGFVGSVVYLRRCHLPLWPWADAAAPSLALGLMLTRIGCYLYGCDFGKPLSEGAPTWLRKLGTFPHWPDGTVPGGDGAPAWLQHVQTRGLSIDAEFSLPVHPTQLYESGVGLALLALLLAVRRRQQFRGELFLVLVFAYGLARFLLEMLRDDPERGGVGPLLPTHVAIPVALVLFALAYTGGIAPRIARSALRRASEVASFLLPIVAYLGLRPSSFGEATLMRISTSQGAAVATATAAAVTYALIRRSVALGLVDGVAKRLASQ